MEVDGHRHVPAVLPREKGTGTNCTGSWVGSSLEGCRKSRPHLDSNTKPSSQQRVAVSLGNDTAVQWC
jgi:hypothetical protein